MKKPLALIAALLLSTAAFAGADISDVKLDVNDPMSVVIKHSMQQRVSRLVKFYEPGVIGLANNGDVAIAAPERLGKIATRQIVEKLLDAENSDRLALIAALAKHANRNDAIPEIRAAMTKRWAAEMKSGWMIQDEKGVWNKKP
ncbi:MAG: YdbL family protein [Sterolibacteriaceae bacterium MAG5]|nr:YdbL family protein [Candidatus Nitricoxidireducens bremensis]